MVRNRDFRNKFILKIITIADYFAVKFSYFFPCFFLILYELNRHNNKKNTQQIKKSPLTVKVYNCWVVPYWFVTVQKYIPVSFFVTWRIFKNTWSRKRILLVGSNILGTFPPCVLDHCQLVVYFLLTMHLNLAVSPSSSTISFFFSRVKICGSKQWKYNLI